MRRSATSSVLPTTWGPPEYAAMMDVVYGAQADMTSLADDARWQQFLKRTDELPAPKINSTFALSAQTMDAERGWRFLGAALHPGRFYHPESAVR